MGVGSMSKLRMCVVTRVSATRASSSSTSTFRVSVPIAMLKYQLSPFRRQDMTSESGHLQTKFGPLIKLVLWSLPPSRADVRPLEPGLALDCQTGHPGGGGVAPGARCAGRDVAGLGVVWRG